MSESESIRLSSFEFHSQKLFALSLPSCFINCRSVAVKWVICTVFNAWIYFMRRKCCICHTINDSCFGTVTKYLPVLELASKLSRPSAMTSLLRKAWLAFCEYLCKKQITARVIMSSCRWNKEDLLQHLHRPATLKDILKLLTCTMFAYCYTQIYGSPMGICREEKRHL